MKDAPNPKIINGKYFANKLLEDLKQNVNCIKDRYNISPTLAIILVGGSPSSIIYVRNKLKTASMVGIETILVHLHDHTTTETLLIEIDKLNYLPNVSGIIVQLPLPNHIDMAQILCAIDPSKDVDGFHALNVGYLHSKLGNGFIPCTALGIIYLLKQFVASLLGKNVVVIGRSNIVGKPLSALLLSEDCTVTICHSKTENLSSISSKADIVVSAIGSPKLLTQEYFREDSIVIDVGISSDNNKITGDVDFDQVMPIVKYITPVPGGVGPMTIAFLLKNTFAAMTRNINISKL